MYAMPNPASAALSIWSVMLAANCGLQSAISESCVPASRRVCPLCNGMHATHRNIPFHGATRHQVEANPLSFLRSDSMVRRTASPL